MSGPPDGCRGRRSGTQVLPPTRRPGAFALTALAALISLALGLTAAVAGSALAAAADRGIGFELRHTKVSPKHPYVLGERKIRLRYRFAARRPTRLEVRVVRVGKSRVVRAWTERRARPGSHMQRAWNGLNRRGKPVGDGRYRFQVGPRGGPMRNAGGELRLHGHVFPVDGPHGTRGPIGEFGAGRNGGRTHEGFDITADCGTTLVAARAGTVAKVGYDDDLYGYYVLIDGFGTGQDYFYSHLIAPPPLDRGDRVKTGQRVGAVGQTGNAASTPCHLHFEIREGGRPVDPEPALRRWDRWS